MALGWYDEKTFDRKSYEALDDPLSGDIHQICPKLVTFKGPLSDGSAYRQPCSRCHLRSCRIMVGRSSPAAARPRGLARYRSWAGGRARKHALRCPASHGSASGVTSYMRLAILISLSKEKNSFNTKAHN